MNIICEKLKDHIRYGFYKDGSFIYHREDGPAVEYTDGDKHWYINGKRHREDGPAIEFIDGAKFWYVDGKKHREDGPAGEYANGLKNYWYNDKYYNSFKEMKLAIVLG